MGRLMDEILSNTPDEGLDIRSAPDEVKIAYTALRVVFGFDPPIDRLIRFGHMVSEENSTFNGYTNYAIDLVDFLNRKPSDYGGLLRHLVSFAEFLECYAIAKAYDESGEVRRAVDVIEGDARVPRDVRDLMRRIRDSETREMLYDLVDSVILKPLEKLGKREKLEEVTERLNKLVGYAKVSLTSYGKLVSGKLDGVFSDGAKKWHYEYLEKDNVGGNILNFGWSIKDEELYSVYSVGNINKRGEYRRPTDEDWAYQVKNLYNVAKELMGVCAETLEKYVNTRQAVITP